jgi:hypothetical protein
MCENNLPPPHGFFTRAGILFLGVGMKPFYISETSPGSHRTLAGAGSI